MKNISAKQTDDFLLDLIQRQDDLEAFSELYRRYWEMLMNAAYKRLKNKVSAEEAVQIIFVSFFMRRHDISLSSSLQAYLLQALKLHIFNTYRTRQYHERYLNHVSSLTDSQPLRPDTIMETKELRDKIIKATEKMPNKCREIFLMNRFEYLSQQDIADKLGISLSTVKKHLHKATGILKKELDDYQFHLILLSILFLSR